MMNETKLILMMILIDSWISVALSQQFMFIFVYNYKTY